jgi:tryptophan synthase alpha chain
MPVGVGFGIKDAESAAAVGVVADAVVVGSALVNQVEANAVNPEAISPAICSILRSIRSALDAL